MMTTQVVIIAEIDRMLVELLQQLGFNKYEAEAYSTLLAQGPLTGYELGKLSHVPLSRSYEILERLAQKGLALVQPGNPVRYRAQEPQQFLVRLRSTMEAQLDALAASLTTLASPDTTGDYWVVRGRQHIIAQARAMIAAAQHTLDLTLPAACDAELADVLADAQERGCHIFRSSLSLSQAVAGPDICLLLVDHREALAGTLSPADSCQATVSGNKALLAALRGYFAYQQSGRNSAPAAAFAARRQEEHADWLAWEESKQRRLWRMTAEDHVA